MMRGLLLLMAAFVLIGGVPTAAAAPAGTDAASSRGSDADVALAMADGREVIVVLDEGEDPVAVAQEMGVTITHVYQHVFNGFAGIAPADVGVASLSARSGERIFEDGRVRLESQIVPTGVRRIAVPLEPGTDHLAISSPVNADIAILDTGVTGAGDLAIAGGKSCIDTGKPDKKDKRKSHKKRKGKKSKHHKKHDRRQSKHHKKERRRDKRRAEDKSTRPSAWADDHFHGTHTAGIAAAIDNDRDVVGVAPGARIWAVKVLDAQGQGFISDVICGLDWVVQHKKTIDVANMSLSAAGSDGSCNSTALHRAVCSTVNAGIPVIVAAGNQGAEASTRVPAAYDQVVTVSGFADSDGLPGHLGPPTCSEHDDDTFLTFSNFGAAVDIAAPGDCILSLFPDGSLEELSGTSEAAPHVTGAAANFIATYLAEHGERPTPEQTRAWLLSEASRPQNSADGFTGDPDGSHEPVLWLADLPTAQ